jgi:hemolysin III
LNLLLWDRVKPLHLGIYLAMGWLVVLVWEPLGESLAPEQLRWIGIGGVLYTIGVGFYLMKRLPLGHVVWHLFVVAGTLALYLGIAHGPIPCVTA